jgi:Na+-driven multidrug efflux pump
MNQVFCYVHHHNWVLTASTAVEVVVNIALSLLLMQWLGLIGIPLATVLAYGLQKAFLVWYVRTKFTVRFREYVPVRQCIWYFAAILLCVFISEMIYF